MSWSNKWCVIGVINFLMVDRMSMISEVDGHTSLKISLCSSGFWRTITIWLQNSIGISHEYSNPYCTKSQNSSCSGNCVQGGCWRTSHPKENNRMHESSINISAAVPQEGDEFLDKIISCEMRATHIVLESTAEK